MNFMPRKSQRPSSVAWSNMLGTEKAAATVGLPVAAAIAVDVDEGISSEGYAKIIVPAIWLFLWIVNNIGITMLNKWAFSYAGFHYPFTASAFHMFCNWLGTLIYFLVSGVPRQEVKGAQWIPLVMFSVVFSLNIGIGNLSSMLVSVKFNQVMRSLVPGIVMFIGIQMFSKTFTKERKLAVIPIVVGVALACQGEMEVTILSFLITCFCIILAALKVVLSGEMLTGNMKMPPLHLLSRMAPLALVQMAVASFCMGEVNNIVNEWDTLMKGYTLWVVALTGLGSFSLNFTSLMANKVTSPLTLSIMANVKQVLLIAVSSIVFGTDISAFNFLGIVIVVVGSFRYSMLSIAESNRPKPVQVSEDKGPLLPK